MMKIVKYTYPSSIKPRYYLGTSEDMLTDGVEKDIYLDEDNSIVLMTKDENANPDSIESKTLDIDANDLYELLEEYSQ